MKPFGKLMTRLDAVRLIEENTRRIARVEEVPIGDAAGRVLAERCCRRFQRAALQQELYGRLRGEGGGHGGAATKPVR